MRGADSFTVSQATFGKIAIERVLKGNAGTQVAYHETWPSWMCDTTAAHTGERCVFFLHPGAVSRADATVREALNTALGAAPVLVNVGSGDGFVVIQEDESGPFVSFGQAPDALLSVPSGGFRDSFERAQQSAHIPLERFVAYVETLGRFDRASLTVFARASTPVQKGEAPFHLRILPNGEARLALEEPMRGETQVRTFTLPLWDELRAELRLIVSADDSVYCRANPGVTPQRELVVHIDGRRIQFNESGNLLREPVDPPRRAAATHCLRAWSLVRGAIDCAECVDHREQDLNWLGR